MKKKVLFLMIIFLFCGCSFKGRTSYGENFFINIYFINIYLDRNDDGFFENNLIKNIKYNSLQNIFICTNNCFISKKPEIIKFYQDKEKKCFLYAYTDYELLKIQRNIFLNDKEYRENENKKYILTLLDKKGAKAITKEGYEQNKQNYKPHPYDPTLCKPDPSYEELYKMKGIK